MLPEVENLIRKQKTYLKEVLSFKPGDCGIISNGRILGPFAPNEEFLTADFLLLEKYALNSYAEKVYRAIKSNLGIKKIYIIIVIILCKLLFILLRRDPLWCRLYYIIRPQ